ncbi:uncharacterized protein NPIL_621381 [Nephila pilipes]|uniref:Uncharacterized protein n=1 Tax=Nephila pilipes TaxID=299642 RepID=A0A8X6N6T3_NEPPI|nr:uncharacterized protein NPIL_621381 [Nephila pilipes]
MNSALRKQKARKQDDPKRDESSSFYVLNFQAQKHMFPMSITPYLAGVAPLYLSVKEEEGKRKVWASEVCPTRTIFFIQCLDSNKYNLLAFSSLYVVDYDTSRLWPTVSEPVVGGICQRLKSFHPHLMF